MTTTVSTLAKVNELLEDLGVDFIKGSIAYYEARADRDEWIIRTFGISSQQRAWYRQHAAAMLANRAVRVAALEGVAA